MFQNEFTSRYTANRGRALLAIWPLVEVRWSEVCIESRQRAMKQRVYDEWLRYHGVGISERRMVL